MRLNSTGLGIGTTSPSEKLHVVGKAYFFNGTSNAVRIDTTVADTTTRDAIYLVEGDGQSTGRQAISWFNTNQNYYKARIWTQVGSSYANTVFGIDVANNAQTVDTRLAIYNGNVGIGTTSPGEKLEVNGNIKALGSIIFRDASNGNTYGFRGLSGIITLDAGGQYPTGWNFQYGGSSSSALYINSSGNVGIGSTSPSDKLDVAGGIITRNTRVTTSQKVPLGHYTPGDTVFEIDPTWTEAQLQAYFNSSGVTWVTDTTAPGGYSIQIAGSINVGGVYNSGFPYIPVDQDDVFYMECWIKNTFGSNNTHYMGSIDYNSSFTSLGGNPGSFGYWVMSNTNPGTSWTKVSGYIGGFGSSTGQFVSGTKFWTPQALFNYSNSGTCYISGWKVIKITHPGYRIMRADGVPLVVNSTNSNNNKIQLSDNATVRGYLGASSANAFMVADSGGTTRLSLTSGGLLTVSSDVVAYGSPSDITYKHDIQQVTNALDTVQKLRGVTFKWNQDTEVYQMTKLDSDIGFIAQEVQEVLPTIVRENENGKLSLRDKAIIPLLVEAIKELSQQNKEFQQRIEELEKK